MFQAIDCQAYAGGFTLGIVQAGFKLVGKREMKGGFGVQNCEVNRHLLGNEWLAEVGAPHTWTARPADVVFGNPPCSGWSAMSAKHFRGASSPILACTRAFVDFAARVAPQVVIFESVQQAFTHKDGLPTMRALHQQLEEKTNEKWTLYHVLHNAYSVGGAAIRRRYFWIASRIPFGIELPRSTSLPLLNDVIGDLSGLTSSWDAQPYDDAVPSHWATSRRSPHNVVDGHVSVRNPLTRRLADILSEVEWNPGEHLAIVARRYYQKMGKLPDSWAATEKKVVKNEFFMGYTTPIRWNGFQPARVITGGSLFTTIHPFLPRTITHREAARILGFPDTWNLVQLKNLPGLAATHGKGITVDCGRWIGGWIHNALSGEPGTHTGLKINENEFVIDVTNSYKSSSNLVQLSSTATPLVARVLKSTKGKIMTDPNGVPEIPVVDAVDGEAVATETTDETKSKGRPRSDETLARDEKAFEALAGDGKTKEELAEAMGVTPNFAYLSLWRLNRDGKIQKVRKDGKFVWQHKGTVNEILEVSTAPEATDEAAPVEAPVAI